MTYTIKDIPCTFCKKTMVQDGNWWTCRPCRYNFVYGEDGAHHRFDVELGYWACALNLYPDINRTIVTAFRFNDPQNEDYIPETRIELPHCMDNVTPENVVEKIKLILVFS